MSQTITIDLTHPLTSQTPVYPSDPPFQSTPHASHHPDGYSVHRLSLGTHTGTHLDAPYHFHATGDHVGQLPLERLCGAFHIVDLAAAADELIVGGHGLREREKIGWETLDRRMPGDLRPGTILLVRTAWPSGQHYFSHPYFCPTIARRLIARGITVVGVDIPSPDETPRGDGSTEGGDGFGFHEQFLGSGGVIVENLTNLGELVRAVEDGEGRWMVSVVPLKLDGLDGSPVRAFAFRVPG